MIRIINPRATGSWQQGEEGGWAKGAVCSACAAAALAAVESAEQQGRGGEARRRPDEGRRGLGLRCRDDDGEMWKMHRRHRWGLVSHWVLG